MRVYIYKKSVDIMSMSVALLDVYIKLYQSVFILTDFFSYS